MHDSCYLIKTFNFVIALSRSEELEQVQIFPHLTKTFRLVPLLLLENRIAQGENGRMFWLSFLAFFVWNVATTWWVWNATPAAILAWILNALFMTIVFQVFHLTKKKVCNKPWGNFFLIPYWMAFELLTYWWSIKWPWLNLGHAFSTQHEWICGGSTYSSGGQTIVFVPVSETR